MKTIADLIGEHPFFEGLTDEHIELIAGCGRNEAFKPKEFLFRTGDAATEFYIVRTGRIAIEVPSSTGVIKVQTVEAGGVVGWSWLMPPHEWRFDGQATETTRVVSLDGVCLRNKFEDNYELGYELMKRFAAIVVERLETTRLQLLDLYGSG